MGTGSLPRLGWLTAAAALTVAFVAVSPAQAVGAQRHHPAAHKQNAAYARTAAAQVQATGVELARGAGYGSRDGSRAVGVLQRRLARLGLTPGPVDGRYGPLTERAVLRFQVQRGLSVDGIAGPRTLAALVVATPVLYPGASSSEVRALQRRLAGLHLAPGPVDGRYGPLTTAAVERFQRAHRLPVDGIVGALTWRALRAATHHRSVPSAALSKPASRPFPRTRTIPTPNPAPAAGQQRHVPAVPVTLVLLGLAALGVGTAALSYARTRARVRRQWRPAQPPPGASAQWRRIPADTLISAHGESKR